MTVRPFIQDLVLGKENFIVEKDIQHKIDAHVAHAMGFAVPQMDALALLVKDIYSQTYQIKEMTSSLLFIEELEFHQNAIIVEESIHKKENANVKSVMASVDLQMGVSARHVQDTQSLS